LEGTFAPAKCIFCCETYLRSWHIFRSGHPCILWNFRGPPKRQELLPWCVLGDNPADDGAGWDRHPVWSGYFLMSWMLDWPTTTIANEINVQVNKIASVHVEKTTYDRLLRCHNISNSVS
jgi:hypothetical protein